MILLVCMRTRMRALRVRRIGTPACPWLPSRRHLHILARKADDQPPGSPIKSNLESDLTYGWVARFPSGRWGQARKGALVVDQRDDLRYGAPGSGQSPVSSPNLQKSIVESDLRLSLAPFILEAGWLCQTIWRMPSGRCGSPCFHLHFVSDGPRKWPLRRIVDAVLHLLHGGLPWRMLPPCFPPVSSVRR